MPIYLCETVLLDELGAVWGSKKVPITLIWHLWGSKKLYGVVKNSKLASIRPLKEILSRKVSEG